MSLLRAVGDQGELVSFERREDFADIAKGNARAFFGRDHPAWRVVVGDLAERLPEAVEPASADRAVLDMLAPWECLAAVSGVMVPGGVLICYVATTTQLSRMAEAVREHGGFTEPAAWESLVRGWHLEGMAVRPQHRMHGHTGFLLTTRRLAPGVTPPRRTRRPAKGASPALEDDGIWERSGASVEGETTSEGFGERPVSDRKVRRARRSVSETFAD
jgi:tRNA (adenine57-N1/adenine58-N1)-methyltransferase